jgi:hypothetical protein
LERSSFAKMQTIAILFLEIFLPKPLCHNRELPIGADGGIVALDNMNLRGSALPPQQSLTLPTPDQL